MAVGGSQIHRLEAGGHGSLGMSTANPSVLRAFWELWNSTGNWMTEGQQWGLQGPSYPLPVVQGG